MIGITCKRACQATAHRVTSAAVKRIALFLGVLAVGCLACVEESAVPPPAPPPLNWRPLDAAPSTIAEPAAASSAAAQADPSAARVDALKKLADLGAKPDGKAFAQAYAADAIVVVYGLSEWKGRTDIEVMHEKLFRPFGD